MGRYPDNPRDAFEALCRLLFRTRYGIADSLPYFYNHPGIETAPVTDGNDVVGYQSKFFTGEVIDDSQADELIHSIQTAKKHYVNKHNANLTKILLFTNSAFWFPKPDEDATKRQKKVEQVATNCGLAIEWMFGDNILDAADKNELAYDLFFNQNNRLTHLPQSVETWNEICFRNIDDSIQYGQKTIELNRTPYYTRLKDLLYHQQHVIISGESGTGKSAITKQWWKEIKTQEEVAVCYLPAQQFNALTVNDVFTLDENYSLSDFKRFYAGHAAKILIVDAAEKLLDCDSIVAQLVFDELEKEDWIFVFTCKSNSFKEMQEKLKAYTIEAECINVELVSEEELNDIHKKYGLPLPKNEKVRQQIKIPFYLARYCELNDAELSSPAALREKVWNRKVRGTLRGAEQIKREECLKSIVREQQEIGAFIANPKGLDYEMAFKLVEEDILVEHLHKGFSIKHDLYVDWAMDYTIISDFETQTSFEKILDAAPISLTYANAFRRWFGSVIDQQDVRVDEIVKLYNEGKVHQKWEHHILSSIGSSVQYVTTFFRKYNDKLAEDDFALFDKFVDILAVACQEVDQTITYKGEQIQLMKPVGAGWDEAVRFVAVHQDDYYMDHLGAVQKLLTTYSRKGNKASAVKEAGYLSLNLFEYIAKERQAGEHFWIENPRPWSELVCKYAATTHEELQNIFNRIIDNRWTKHTDPYSELTAYIIKEADLWSIYNICLYCNDGILQLLDLFWKEHPEDEDNDSYYVGHRHSGFDREYVFGLNSEYGIDMGYFPESSQQTPIYALLMTEHIRDLRGMKVLSFIVDLMNYCVETYEQRSNAEHLKRISLELPDGGSHEIIVSQSLWNMYRGTPNVSMPNALVSMHMALESFLLGLVDDKEYEDWDYLGNALWYIIRHSRSGSLYGVVASLAVAHPDHYYDILLYLCQDIRLISMDLTRSISEHHATSIEFAYHRHPSMLEERRKSNKLPHRQQCLETVLFNCQLNYDQAQGEDSKKKLSRAYLIVDKLREQKEELRNEDSTYKFIFERIDYRSMKKQPVNLGNGQKGILITPNTTPEMEAEREQLNVMMKDMNAMSLRVWAVKKYKSNGKEMPEYKFDTDVRLVIETIRAIDKQLRERNGDLLLLPGDEYVQYIGSAILLMYYSAELTVSERNECRELLMEALMSPEALLSNSLSEVDICIAALPAAIAAKPEEKEAYANIISGYAEIKDENVNKRLCDVMMEVITANDLWHTYPEIMDRALELTKNKLPQGDFPLMDEYQADTVLCLLTYKTEKRELGRLCIEKLSNRWRKKEERFVVDHKSHEADNIAMYILNSPREEVRLLVAPYVKLIGNDDYDEPLMTSLLLSAAQYDKYDNFWIAWFEFYDTITAHGGQNCQDHVLNEYLFNPRFLTRDYNDWFRLEEKDMLFFEKVVYDMGGNPIVLFAIARVFATIGQSLQKQAIGLFVEIITKHHVSLQDKMNVVVYYLEKIVKRIVATYGNSIKTEQTFRKDVIAVLEFIRDNGSTEAQSLLNTL